MRLVKLPELKELPAGTLFAPMQQEWVFGELEIKGDNFGPDFWVRSLAWVDAFDSGEATDRLDEMALDSSVSYPINQAYQRNCDYDDESLYLVYEPDDVEYLAAELGLVGACDKRDEGESADHSRHDVITFAIRDYASELSDKDPGDRPLVALLWKSSDDIADKIEYRLNQDSVGP